VYSHDSQTKAVKDKCGVIVLSPTTSIEGKADYKSKKNCFLVKSDHRVYALTTKTEAEMWNWVAWLKEIVEPGMKEELVRRGEEEEATKSSLAWCVVFTRSYLTVRPVHFFGRREAREEEGEKVSLIGRDIFLTKNGKKEGGGKASLTFSQDQSPAYPRSRAMVWSMKILMLMTSLYVFLPPLHIYLAPLPVCFFPLLSLFLSLLTPYRRRPVLELKILICSK
jgi:hypothetical protein